MNLSIQGKACGWSFLRPLSPGIANRRHPGGSALRNPSFQGGPVNPRVPGTFEECKSILGLAPEAPLHPPPSFALAGALRRKDW